MRVHMTLFFWWFLIADIIWREVSKKNAVQARLHKLGPLAIFLQWYVLFFIGYGIVLAWAMYEMVFHYLPTSDEDIDRNIEAVWHEEKLVDAKLAAFNVLRNQTMPPFMGLEQFKLELTIRPWLRCLSWISVVCSAAVYVVLFGHIMKYARDCNKNKAHEIEGTMASFGVWRPPIRMNMVMLILVNPGVFSVMALRALCRIWALMTGQASNGHHLGWPQLKTFEYAMFTGDMELAQAFQYFCVHVFARLCGEYLCDSGILRAYSLVVPASQEEEFKQHALEYKRMVRWAAFLAVHAFVGLGMVRCLIDFMICEARVYESYADRAEVVQVAMSDKLTTVFQALTILCVINMKIICDMKDITSKLPKATLMFLGTRILLLISDNQAVFVTGFTVGSVLHEKLAEKGKTLSFWNDLPAWNFYEHQAHLFHLALLNIECLVCVLFNVFAWKALDIEKSELMSARPMSALLDVDSEAAAESAESTKGLLAGQALE